MLVKEPPAADRRVSKSCLKEQDYSLLISQNERLLKFAKPDIMTLR